MSGMVLQLGGGRVKISEKSLLWRGGGFRNFYFDEGGGENLLWGGGGGAGGGSHNFEVKIKTA